MDDEDNELPELEEVGNDDEQDLEQDLDQDIVQDLINNEDDIVVKEEDNIDDDDDQIAVTSEEEENESLQDSEDDNIDTTDNIEVLDNIEEAMKNNTGNIALDSCVYTTNNISNIEEIEEHNRVSLPILTKYEEIRILAVRTQQLALGAPPFVKNIINKSPLEIAKIELEYNMIPFKIKRYLPTDKRYEVWKLSELSRNKS